MLIVRAFGRRLLGGWGCAVFWVLISFLGTGCAGDFGRGGDEGESSAGAGQSRTAFQRPPSLSVLQQRLMDFSDRYVSAVWQVLDDYIAAEPEVSKQVLAQRMKVRLGTAAMGIASSRDPRANILDMAVFLSAGRWAVDRYWVPEMLGERAAPLRGVYARMEREIWEQVDETLSPSQRADLRSLIAQWEAGNPPPWEVLDVRLRNLDGVVLSRFQESASARGLLSNVRKLLGKVDQSLLYGERMMFYVERTPRILAQQADLTVDRVAERFPIATANPDFDAWMETVRGLPDRFRDALLTAENPDLVPGIQRTVDSAERITTSLQTTLASADSLAARMEKLPFQPGDYVAALDQASASLDKAGTVVEGLNRLLDEESLDRRTTRINELTTALDARVDRLVENIFHRALILIGALIAGLLLVVVIARVLFSRRREAKTDPPQANNN